MNPVGTVALVTGGARRVGRAIVMELARAGCDLALHYYKSRAEAERVAAEVASIGRRALTVAGDLADPATWQPIVDRTTDAFGRLDALVNNASIFLTESPDTLEGFSVAQWESMLRTNLIAPVGLCHHARPHLEAHGTGKIVNLCDASIDRPWPAHLAYSASKAALATVTRALARTLAPRIQVNAVAPGIALFPESYTLAVRQNLVGKVPLQRPGTPEEVARLVRFLIEDGDYITGQMISIDGGRSLV